RLDPRLLRAALIPSRICAQSRRQGAGRGMVDPVWHALPGPLLHVSRDPQAPPQHARLRRRRRWRIRYLGYETAFISAEAAALESDSPGARCDPVWIDGACRRPQPTHSFERLPELFDGRNEIPDGSAGSGRPRGGSRLAPARIDVDGLLLARWRCGSERLAI